MTDPGKWLAVSLQFCKNIVLKYVESVINKIESRPLRQFVNCG